jgi:hypothetical protein
MAAREQRAGPLATRARDEVGDQEDRTISSAVYFASSIAPSANSARMRRRGDGSRRAHPVER